MQTRTTTFITAALLALLCLAGAGCELGTNPLLFDGAPLSATFDIEHTALPGFLVDTTINLQSALENIDKDIDSVHIFNVTIQIEQLDDNGGGAVTLTAGGVRIDADTLFTVSNIPVSAFANERSIFDNSLGSAFTYNTTGVDYLINLVKQRPLPTIQVTAAGTTNVANFHLRVHFRVYTQVYTNP